MTSLNFFLLLSLAPIITSFILIQNRPNIPLTLPPLRRHQKADVTAVSIIPEGPATIADGLTAHSAATIGGNDWVVYNDDVTVRHHHRTTPPPQFTQGIVIPITDGPTEPPVTV